MGWFRVFGARSIVLIAAISVACADPSGTDIPAGTPTPSSISGGLALVRTGTVLHAGNYCHFLQVATPGDNTLPVTGGCQFNLTKPADVFATDGSDYSVSEVVGDATLGVRGPPDARVMIVCRLSPRAQFWFWISADAHWNVDRVDDIHNPQDLVSAGDEESLRQFVKVNDSNRVQFKCAGGSSSHEVSLALNVNGRQFTAITLPMPAAGTPLARPATPWFVDLGARLTTEGTLEGSVAGVLLYSNE